ncbi:ABC transporter ATP-binding protein [Marivita sp. S0852]|uniref:ABC transporter ATP-binding protein n=1 Tax=Marivita sp. S0852 TaxID=3373893 RepID=UPI0039822293
MVNDATFAPWTAPGATPLIEFRNVTKRFGDFTAIDDLTQGIFEKEFFALLGPSGCGKTTMMRMLAGFETPTEGQILIDGQDVAHVPPNRRAVNMMFQSYALFPHLSVWENIAFGLKRESKNKEAIAARVEEMLRLTRLSKFAQRKPHQISGGQRQRVALARSLAKAPKLLLLDEPLGALDKKLRQDTQFELMDIQEKTGTTFVIVTHDQEEAMTVASRVAVMNEGRIIQVATPDEIYEAPNSVYVADFIGDVNLIEGKAQARPTKAPAAPAKQEQQTVAAPPATKTAADGPQPNAYGEWLQNKVLFPFLGKRDPQPKQLPAPAASPPDTPTQPVATTPVQEGGFALHWADGQPSIIVANGDAGLVGEQITLAMRPEKLSIAKNKPDAPNVLPGKVIDIAYLGNLSTYHVELENGVMIRVQMTNIRRIARRDITWEDNVWVSFTETAGVVLRG